MDFRIVSHACLDVKARGKRLIIDPWLNEPTYWSSWWHAPPPVFGPDLFAADYVYIRTGISTIFDPRTLKKFAKTTTVIVPVSQFLVYANSLPTSDSNGSSSFPTARPSSSPRASR